MVDVIVVYCRSRFWLPSEGIFRNMRVDSLAGVGMFAFFVSIVPTSLRVCVDACLSSPAMARIATALRQGYLCVAWSTAWGSFCFFANSTYRPECSLWARPFWFQKRQYAGIFHSKLRVRFNTFPYISLQSWDRNRYFWYTGHIRKSGSWQLVRKFWQISSAGNIAGYLI